MLIRSWLLTFCIALAVSMQMALAAGSPASESADSNCTKDPKLDIAVTGMGVTARDSYIKLEQELEMRTPSEDDISLWFFSEVCPNSTTSFTQILDTRFFFLASSQSSELFSVMLMDTPERVAHGRPSHVLQSTNALIGLLNPTLSESERDQLTAKINDSALVAFKRANKPVLGDAITVGSVSYFASYFVDSNGKAGLGIVTARKAQPAENTK